MKTVNLDKLCRIVIPVEYRKALQIDAGSALTVCMEKGAIVIRPTSASCRICGGKAVADASLPLCRACVAQVKKI